MNHYATEMEFLGLLFWFWGKQGILGGRFAGGRGNFPPPLLFFDGEGGLEIGGWGLMY